MKPYDIDKYLRQNPQGKKGSPGTYRLRFYFSPSKVLKPSRIEIGLGTADKNEARIRASIFLRGLYALGYEVSSRITLMDCKQITHSRADFYPPKTDLQMTLDLQ